ncbi:MAG: SMI1/KNR4 family protein [Candidatus Cloacimonetes bacterium]|nr:SMI1/KNR4 family protein [Candidatus Cloacimonadota bacterium]
MIEQIEDSLNINLPVFYKNTLLNYPFTLHSFSHEFMLVNDLEIILSYNQLDFLKIINKPNCFVIGSDGGEEYYYILLNDNDTVYTYSLETKKSEIYSNNWTDYIN